MKKLIVANWKELPATLGEAEEILEYLSEELNEQIAEKTDIVLCPPEKYRQMVAEALSKEPLFEYAELGLQDIPLVGLKNSKLEINNSPTYVIIGHSSRRTFESDEIVNQKLKLALARELTPIVCIGERDRDEHFEQFLKDQVAATFAGLSAGEIEKCFIAYEPVWAISTNPGAKPDTPESSRESIGLIRDYLNSKFSPFGRSLRQAPNPKFLYGGSITVKNVATFLAMPEISGVLIGGASVRKEEFLEILMQV